MSFSSVKFNRIFNVYSVITKHFKSVSNSSLDKMVQGHLVNDRKTTATATKTIKLDPGLTPNSKINY